MTLKEIQELDSTRTMIDVDEIVAISDSSLIIKDHVEIYMSGGARIVLNIPYSTILETLYGG